VDKIERLAEILKQSKHLCVFTGAGISVPSGIPDFRSAQGLYNSDSGYGYPPEQIISRTFFDEKPALFYQFYKEKMLFPNAKPNDAHRFFASLETADRHVSVVTQNIDGLHQAAGSTDVYELHGSVHRNNCMNCGKAYTLKELIAKPGVPRCDKCGGVIKPDVVLYEEPLNEDVVYGAVNAIRKSDVMVVVGTSLVVYPAASYLRYFSGKSLILINKSETAFDRSADIAINDDVVKVVHQLQQYGV